MELRFEEYCDADLSLIRDYYETTFSHYVPDLAGTDLRGTQDAHWLVEGRAPARRTGLLPPVRFPVVAALPVTGAGLRLLQHAYGDLLDKPVICHAFQLKNPSTSGGLCHLPLHELDGPLHALYHQQRGQGYQIGLLVASS